MSRIKNDPSHLFTLHYHLSGGFVTIHAWDANVRDDTGHNRIDAELHFHPKGKARACIFPRGATWCGTAAGTTVDGNEARALVTSLFATGLDGYTEEQLAWAQAYGEELSIEREARFCDENGAVKK